MNVPRKYEGTIPILWTGSVHLIRMNKGNWWWIHNLFFFIKTKPFVVTKQLWNASHCGYNRIKQQNLNNNVYISFSVRVLKLSLPKKKCQKYLLSEKSFCCAGNMNVFILYCLKTLLFFTQLNIVAHICASRKGWEINSFSKIWSGLDFWVKVTTPLTTL